MSRWDSPEAAREFAQFYSSYTPQRYSVHPGSAPAASARSDEAGVLKLNWDFGREGKVVIETAGDWMVVLEGCNDTLMNRLPKELLAGPHK